MPGPGVYSFDTNTLSTTGGGTEDTLATNTTTCVNVAGVFTLFVDLNDMAAGDVIEFRAYKMVRTGGTSRVMQGYPITLAGAQPTDGLILEIGPIPNDLTDNASIKFTAKQTFGTAGVSLPWKVVNAFDGTANTTQWLGTACAPPTVAGVPEVDLTHVAGATTNVAALATNVDAILTDTGTTLDARIPAALVGGRMDVSVGAMAANVLTASALATDAVNEIVDQVWDELQADHVAVGSFGITASEIADILVDTAEIGAAGAGLTALATQASVNTIDDFLDTEIAAIKAKTDSLTFTVAGQVDANIQYVNDTAVTGDGGSGTEWGPV